MGGMNRKQFVLGMGATGLVSMTSARAMAAPVPALTQINRDWLVSEEEALAWHKVKDSMGPALTGNASWHNFLQFLEGKLKDYGCVDVHRSSWMFDRMETSYWPDDFKWSLVSNGKRVTVANYGANCGLTGPQGVTAELVLWDPDNKPDVGGKIVVFRPTVRQDVRDALTDADYEYATPFDSYPIEGIPVSQEQNGTHSIAPVVWDELTATSAFVQEISPAKPAGLIFAMNLNKAATAGLYTFGVPKQYDFPSVYVDLTAGDMVVADARAKKSATLRVEGQHIQSEAYQLIAYLPGRDYGTDNDQQIQLRTHTDGPSISQDDGALGLLGVVKYMSNLPQKDRQRSLLVELDCRHFMPGAEQAWRDEDYFVKFPNARDKVVGLVSMEHMGQIEYVFDGDDIKPSGRSSATWIYATANQKVIDFAYKAVQDNHLPSAIIRAPTRPGRHGLTQGPWYGMGSGARLIGLGCGMNADLGAYWTFSGRINRFDPRSFKRQVGAFSQITGFFMASDLADLQAPKVERPQQTVGPLR